MKITPKRALVMVMLAILLAGSALLVGEKSVRTSAPALISDSITEDPIDEFRTERQKLRAMQKAQLSDIAHDAEAEDETRDLARRQLLEFCSNEEKEMTIEGILAARGFSNPVVTVHSGSVNVLLRTEILTRQQSAVILDLVSRETGAMSGDIKIIPIN